MVKRIVAIAFIFICTTVAWIILGGTIFQRTQSSDQTLRGRVGSTWGTSQMQRAPVAFIERIETRVVETPFRRMPPDRELGPQPTTTSAGRPTETVRTRVPLALDQTRVAVDFDLEHRRKGLLWYSTYEVAFAGTFRFRNTAASDSVVFEFPLPAAQAAMAAIMRSRQTCASPRRPPSVEAGSRKCTSTGRAGSPVAWAERMAICPWRSGRRGA